ncbi:hypothetical protein CMK11_17135, partial [Candidatus Poribacteria bacterium]|nr:hypothetical protein [Candidatus Poribacteria bacterium]
MRRSSFSVVTAVAFLLAFPFAPAGAVDAVVGVSPATLDVGIVDVGLSGTADVTITNTGTATLTVTDIGADNGQYTVTPAAFTVGAGLDQVVTVTFVPTVVGCETATLTITHDGTGDSSATVTGIGSITPPIGDLQGDTRIAHESTVDGNTDIYTADIDGLNRTRVTTDVNEDRMPTWNADGTRLAFASNRAGTWQIYTIGADLTGLTNISANGYNDWLPKWSPDGTTIAFESDRSGSGAEVWLMDPTGANQRAQPGLAGLTDAGHPGWAPDDSKIVFQARPAGNWEVYVVDVDGQDLQNLTNEAGSIDEQASWSSDGTQITFRDDNDLTAILACGPVVRSYGGGTVSSWSPDGEWIVYANLSNGISIVSADGASTLAWTPAGSMERTFEWSPFLSPIDPQVVVASPADGDQLAAGTTSATLSVTISNHDAPGYWAWQLDEPFPDTGAIPAGAPWVLTGDTDTVSPLVDSTTYTVYVALVDGTTDLLLDATEYPSSRDSVTFHVGPATIAITA